MKKVSATLKNHLWGIINAVVLKADNSHAESINSRIKTVKTRARGFRNNKDSVIPFTFILAPCSCIRPEFANDYPP